LTNNNILKFNLSIFPSFQKPE